jgi:hypothetical protein
VADALRREVALDQLAHDALAGDQVGHREVRHAHEATAEQVGERRDAIHHEHRREEERRFDGRGAEATRPSSAAPSTACVSPCTSRAGVPEKASWSCPRCSVGATATANCRLASCAASRAHRARERRQVHRHLALAAARQHGDERPRGVETDACEERGAVRGRLHQVDQRVSDELDRHSGLAVERLFERKDDQHRLRGVADRTDAALPPGPHLRRHVIDDRDAAGVQRARQAQVEVG